jgi:hypothetical protein
MCNTVRYFGAHGIAICLLHSPCLLGILWDYMSGPPSLSAALHLNLPGLISGCGNALIFMNPHKIDRTRVKRLTDLPNVGKAISADLQLLGYSSPEQLVGECPFDMYKRLCQKTRRRHDPCVIDVFMSITEFLKGQQPRPWWEYTNIRKNFLADKHTK